LFISPQHSLLIADALIPVKYLINGRSIAPVDLDETRQFEYFHIELDTHEVIFAEGTPVETLQVARGHEAIDDSVLVDGRKVGRPLAPVLGYHGGRAELLALARLAVSPIVDVRDPIQVAYDRIAARAELVCA
jgi:hypothetical protein